MQKKKGDNKQTSQNKEHQDKEGMAQGADAADASSLQKEIQYDGQTPHQQTRKAG